MKFGEMLSKGVLVSGLIALVVVLTICGLAAVGRPIPEVLVNLALTVVAYYFGTRSGTTVERQATDRRVAEAMQRQSLSGQSQDTCCCESETA